MWIIRYTLWGMSLVCKVPVCQTQGQSSLSGHSVIVSPSQFPLNDHLEGEWLAMSEPCDQRGGDGWWNHFIHFLRGIQELPLISPVPSVFCPSLAERVREGTIHSHFRAWASSSLGTGRGSAVWCLPDVASRLEFLLGHLLVGGFGEINSFFPLLISKMGPIILLRIVKLSKILYIKFPEISNT